ncbi:MAG: hypothetical protein EOO29_06015 [Comamonadaceae bacterium]|nr:MAG: hypothetical protein EOO29_06015 [Comamonadaceae bacterium]
MNGSVGQARRIGVVIGSVLWLSSLSLRAQAADAPCRTPCLAVPTPAPAPEAPAPVPAKPPAAPKAASRPKPAQREVAVSPPSTVARPVRTASPRCTAINLRAQIGEPVSERDLTYLRSEC